MDKGRNHGITGLFDLPGYRLPAGSTAQTPLIHVECLGFTEKINVSLFGAAGRGDGDFPEQDFGTAAGNAVFQCTVAKKDYPVPTGLRGLTGNILLQFDSTADAAENLANPLPATPALQVIDARVIGVSFETNEEDKNLWDLNIITQIRDWPTWSGFGGTGTDAKTQATLANEQHADKKLWEGMSKTGDPNALADQDAERIRVWAMTDNDVAEFQKIASIYQSAATRPGLKLRTVTLTRASRNVVYLNLLWSRKDTKDDQLNPRTTTHTDPDGIGNSASAPAINGVAANPNVPNTVLAATETLKLTDGSNLIVSNYAGWNPKQVIELGESFVRRTLNHLGDSGQDVKVIATTAVATQAAATAPAGLKAVGTFPQNINAFQSKFATIFDVTDDAEKILFPELVTSTDPSLLESHRTKGATYINGNEPAAPGVGGLVLRNKRIIPITSPDITPIGASAPAGQFAIFWLYAQKTTADDRTFGESRDTVDPNDIRSNKTTASIITTGDGAPSPGSTLGVLKLIDSADIPLTNASASNQSLRIFRWGKRDSLDEEKQPRKKTTVEVNGAFATPSNIGDDGIRAKEWLSNASAPTAPDDPPTNNVKPIAYFDLVLTETVGSAPGTNLRVFLYGSKSSADELILPNYETNEDSSGIQSTAIRAALDGDSISDPSGYVLRFTKTRPITQGLAANRILTVKVYGLVTVKTEMENAASVFKGDPFGVYSDRTATIVPVTGSGPVMRAAALAANQADGSFANVEIEILNAQWARKIIETSGEDKKRHSYHGTWIDDHLNGVPVTMVSGLTLLPNIPAAAYGDTAAKVHIKVKDTASGGNGFREFSPTTIRRFRGEFRYRRTFITTDPATYYFLSLMGTTNASPFQGWPAHWVSYSHPEPMWTELIAGAHAVTIDFVFQLDSAMFIIADDIPIGDGGFNDSPHVTSSSFVSATTFDGSALLRWLPTGDYSGFSA